MITSVSQLWNVGKRGGYALFCWDAFFQALARHGLPVIAYNSPRSTLLTRETADALRPVLAGVRRLLG